MFILILTQRYNNKSVLALSRALESYSSTAVTPLDKIETIVWEISQHREVEITSDTVKLILPDTQTHAPMRTTLPIADIKLVIKRTWGPIRDKVLAICEKFEEVGMRVFGRCDWFRWSHSKLSQQRYLDPYVTYPDSYPLPWPSDRLTLQAIADERLGYPFIIKFPSGNRGDGVFLIENEEAIAHFLDYYRQFQQTFSEIICQVFIHTSQDLFLSTYYRVNVIGGRIHNAIKFQFEWISSDNMQGVRVLKDTPNCHDGPITLDPDVLHSMQHLIQAMPYTEGIIGFDIVLSFPDSVFYLLESNSGPAIADIISLGRKFFNSPDISTQHAAALCLSFSSSIAAYIGQILSPEYQAKHRQLNKLLSEKKTKRNMHDTLLRGGFFETDQLRRQSYALACGNERRLSYADSVRHIVLQPFRK